MFNNEFNNSSEGRYYWLPNRIERAALALVQGRRFYEETRVFYGSEEHLRAVVITAKYLHRIDGALDYHDNRVKRLIAKRIPEETEV